MRFGITRTLSECLCTLGFSHELIEADEKLLDRIEVGAIRRQKVADAVEKVVEIIGESSFRFVEGFSDEVGS